MPRDSELTIAAALRRRGRRARAARRRGRATRGAGCGSWRRRTRGTRRRAGCRRHRARRACSRAGGARRGRASTGSTPSTVSDPLVGRSRVAIIENVVDLPAPFGPIRPKIEPRRHDEVHRVDRGERAVALGEPDVRRRRRTAASALAASSRSPPPRRAASPDRPSRRRAAHEHDAAAHRGAAGSSTRRRRRGCRARSSRCRPRRRPRRAWPGRGRRSTQAVGRRARREDVAVHLVARRRPSPNGPNGVRTMAARTVPAPSGRPAGSTGAMRADRGAARGVVAGLDRRRQLVRPTDDAGEARGEQLPPHATPCPRCRARRPVGRSTAAPNGVRPHLVGRGDEPVDATWRADRPVGASPRRQRRRGRRRRRRRTRRRRAARRRCR